MGPQWACPRPLGPGPAETLTTWPQVFLGVKVALKHALIEEHVAHGLRDDDVHLLREGDLLHLPRDDHDPVGEVVTLHQDLQARGREGSWGSLSLPPATRPQGKEGLHPHTATQVPLPPLSAP